MIYLIVKIIPPKNKIDTYLYPLMSPYLLYGQKMEKNNL